MRKRISYFVNLPHASNMDDSLEPQAAGKALEALRAILLRVRPTGPDGFEGLVAVCLATISGRVFRLAKSGSQYGRDARSTGGQFAIAMEAKRYSDPLRLEVLAGKALVGATALSTRTDLWVLGATSEVGEDTVEWLTAIFEGGGISVLVLDWAEQPLPPLAVLLTAAREETIAWFHRYATSSEANQVDASLRVVASAAAYESQVYLLRAAVDAAQVGLDSLRQQARRWFIQRLRDRKASRRSFGQAIAVADDEFPAVARTASMSALQHAVAADTDVIAVLGEEGVGKTWLAAYWWLAWPDGPIPLFVSGRRTQLLEPGEPLESLARIIADQEQLRDAAHLLGWQKRLSRWQNTADEDRTRFLLILDGINEHPSRPWADIITSHAELMRRLGGRLVVTARRSFWRREVVPRLDRRMSVIDVAVGDYTEEELSEVLTHRKVAAADVPERVRNFVRNPRVCAVAIALLERLAITPSELTVERLLLEYWRARLEERGDLIGHTVPDFEKLLCSHARAWREQPRVHFDRDYWAQHSGAAARRGVAAVYDDLTEIEEGRFLSHTTDDGQSYAFRTEVLPFALGLLINSELREALKQQAAVPKGIDPHTSEADVADELLSRILEPVQGFDQISEIVGAAVGLACLDERATPGLREAVIRGWCRLQNRSSHAADALAPYVAARPEPFLRIVEARSVGGAIDLELEPLAAVLVAARDFGAVSERLNKVLPRWLGHWSRQSSGAFASFAGDTHHLSRITAIDTALASLRPSEIARFRELTTEREARAVMQLDALAARLLAGRPLAAHARGIVAWGLVQAVAPDFPHAGEDLQWILRLNQADPSELRQTIERLLQEVDESSSERIRLATAIVLRMLGDDASTRRADVLWLPERHVHWNIAELSCDSDPLDPSAASCSNLDASCATVLALAPQDIWNYMGATVDDHNLERVMPVLARFDVATIVEVLRAVVGTVAERTGFPLRQLAWRLSWLSPILDDLSLERIDEAIQRLIADAARSSPRDRQWILTGLVSARLPHLAGAAQLDLLLGLPRDMRMYTDLRRALAPLPADALESRLIQAVSSSDVAHLAWILFFMSASRASLTPLAREIVLQALDSDDDTTAIMAASAVYAADDAELNAGLLRHAAQRYCAPGRAPSWWYDRAVAAAVLEDRSLTESPPVPLRFLGAIARVRGGAAVEQLTAHVERAVSRALTPLSVNAPDGMRILMHQSESGFGQVMSVVDTSDEVDGALLGGLLGSAEESEGEQDRRSARHKEMVEQALAYESALIANGASAIFDAPDVNGFASMVSYSPSRARQCLQHILDTRDGDLLAQVYNLGVGLASAYASQDAVLAVAALRHLACVKPVITTTIDGLSLIEHATFSAADSPGITEMRSLVVRRARSDADLERVVLVSEYCGAQEWLDSLVSGLLDEPSIGEQARGLTIAGLRSANPQSENVVARAWGSGFLSDVGRIAAERYARDSWARSWYDSAINSRDGVDFWRYTVLVEELVDARYRRWRSLEPRDELRPYMSVLHERLQKAAEKQSAERKKVLFGVKVPSDHLFAPPPAD
jgi:hypothetical protein